ncbi:hypothetical protein L7F22_066462 [Adiantum nelumboides]|nr:hypothetical protein [Adiantum nelumboides]
MLTTHVQAATSISPFKALYGRDPTFLLDIAIVDIQRIKQGAIDWIAFLSKTQPLLRIAIKNNPIQAQTHQKKWTVAREPDGAGDGTLALELGAVGDVAEVGGAVVGNDAGLELVNPGIGVDEHIVVGLAMWGVDPRGLWPQRVVACIHKGCLTVAAAAKAVVAPVDPEHVVAGNRYARRRALHAPNSNVPCTTQILLLQVKVLRRFSTIRREKL